MLIDDRIPFGPKDKHPLCSCIPPNENTKINGQGWLPLLEKTLASVMDGYQCLSGGFPHCALEVRAGEESRPPAGRLAQVKFEVAASADAFVRR